MANQALQSSVQILCDALVDSAKLIKSPSLANAEGAVSAGLSDADLKAQVGALIVGGLSGLEAGLKDLSNIDDDVALIVASVPMIEKVVAALKSA